MKCKQKKKKEGNISKRIFYSAVNMSDAWQVNVVKKWNEKIIVFGRELVFGIGKIDIREGGLECVWNSSNIS